MMTMKNTIFYCLIILIIVNCQNKKRDYSPETKNTPKTELKSNSNGKETTRNDCLCSFKKFGEHKTSDDNYNIYLSGKGWNSNLESCSFTWGEITFNTIPADTSVKILKIHLLDLDQFEIPTDDREYTNDSIKKYVISIYTRDNVKGNYSITYDPFNTGKYSKPKN
ncbi:hypothetical protein CYCD_11850 [Tenuifilaceae bacterium CYCD]|nr:hypothetical protein CYCD_11850 [Tenuifilaceae bacterium CYCD]